MSEQVTGAELLIEALKKNDLKNVYGVVGIPVTDLARMMQRSGMRYFGFRREDSAVNAAAGFWIFNGETGLSIDGFSSRVFKWIGCIRRSNEELLPGDYDFGLIRTSHH